MRTALAWVGGIVVALAVIAAAGLLALDFLLQGRF